MKQQTQINIGIIGLGYVGLPLAIEFAKHFPVVGFDLNSIRIKQLQQGHDLTLEVSHEELSQAQQIEYTTDAAQLKKCNHYIVTVPTPVDRYNRPDLSPLEKASTSVGRCLKPNDIVIYESTVYPCATEEVCVPILAQQSGLTFNRDFFVGYSPERINPGDKHHRLPTIVKITSGSTPETADKVDALYRTIITAGTHKASSIKVAEAAKVIENTQRDVNIALINELALIFNRLSINTDEVLAAAGSKWNFLPFKPGLVGGHCIGVDPYYLTHKAQSLGYHPEIVLAGRRINDGMGVYIAHETVKLMVKNHLCVADARVLVLGLTFKENCPDLRNTKVIDIIKELKTYGTQVDVFDPWVDLAEVEQTHMTALPHWPTTQRYAAVIVAVAHQQFIDIGFEQIHQLLQEDGIIYDVKSMFAPDQADGRL